MSLAEQLNDLNVKLPACGVAKVLLQLDELEAEALKMAVDNPEVSTLKLSKVLKGNGFNISPKTIHRHRSRGTDKDCCSCR